MNKSPEGVKFIFNEDDTLDIQADIEGPKGTPYENGIFRVKIVILSDFPKVAPKGKKKILIFLLIFSFKIFYFYFKMN